MIADLHTHTCLCKHAEGRPEEYLKSAVSKGIAWYGISDHAPWPHGYDTKYRMTAAEFPEYLKIVERMKQLAEGTGTTVLCGIETDFVRGKMDECLAALNQHRNKFDYILGSVHYTADFAFDDPELIHVWNMPGKPEEVWKIYLKCLLDLVKTGSFDIMAHADLPKKFGHFHPFDAFYRKSYEEIFEAAAEKGIALEINTSGLFVPAKEAYPSLELLKMAHAHGLALTYGSDSHAPGNLGRAFDAAVELARAAGYGCFSAFRNHRRFDVPFC